MTKPLDIVVAQRHLRRLLFMTGLNSVFALYDSLAEASGLPATDTGRRRDAPTQSLEVPPREEARRFVL